MFANAAFSAVSSDDVEYQLMNQLDIPVDITGLIAADLAGMRERGTSGKAYAANQSVPGYGVVNRIPSTIKGACTPYLVAYLFDGDNFNARLKEVSDHAGILCPGTQQVVIFTTQWKPVDWEKQHRAVFERLNAHVSIFLVAFGGVSMIV